MTREEAIAYFKRHLDLYCVEGISREAEEMAIKALEQEQKSEWDHDHEILKAYADGANNVLDKINKMKSEIADSLEFWDYSPNNNPLASDMLEILTNFFGDINFGEI